MTIPALDITIIVIYLTAMLGLGFYLGRKESLEGFFVNNRRTKLFLLIFTALSTSMGAGSVIGVVSASYNSGISYAVTFGLISIVAWLFVAWLAPRIKEWGDNLGAYTFGDFFAARYSDATRRVASVVTLTSYFTITAVQFVAFATLAKVVGGISFEVALIISAIITILYTVLAGIKGDFYTDALQFFVMLPVFIFLFIIGFSQIGVDNLFTNIPPDYFNLFNYAGPSFFFAALILGFPLLLVSMEVWQRIFAAVDAKTARRAFIFSGFLKVSFIFAAMIFGFMAFQVVPGAEKDSALFELMKELLPSGLLGFGFASVLAIIMSTIDSMLMVGSATLTKDYYLVKNPQADEKKVLFVGRLSVLLFGIGAFAVALLFQDIVRLAVTSVQILGVFAPALIGGLLWERSTAPAAFWSILIGFITTLVILPFLPDTSFIPAIVLSIIIFITLSLRGKR